MAHRRIIREALRDKPNQTGRELEIFMAYELEYMQIMRRIGEVAKRGITRVCSTGLPIRKVVEWAL